MFAELRALKLSGKPGVLLDVRLIRRVVKTKEYLYIYWRNGETSIYCRRDYDIEGASLMLRSVIGVNPGRRRDGYVSDEG